MARFAAHCHFLPVLDDGFYLRECEAAEAPDEKIAEAKPLGAHGRAISQREDVMRRDVEGFGIRKVKPDERVRLTYLQIQNARPRFATRGCAGSTQML